jgi:hypothetical protein
MKLLIDTDAFCKLGVAGLLTDAVLMVGVELQECGRLPALTYMLRRGSVRRHYGATACDALLPLADSIPVVDQPTEVWLDTLVKIEAVDPGEAQILAAAAEFGHMVLSGDKRALRAAKDVKGLAEALHGRVVVLEAALIELCNQLDLEDVRRHVERLRTLDTMIAACFPPGTSDPRDGLRSYYRSTARDVAPLVLWEPRQGGAE